MTPKPPDKNRTKRAASQSRGGFALVPGDIEILRAVSEHRFLRREQMSTLLGRHAKRLHRRLVKLEENRHLNSIRMPQQKFIYGLGRCGVQILTEQGVIPPTQNERLRTHELKELFLKHEMMIVDIHVAMSMASTHGEVRLAHWREGKELYDSVVAVDRKGSNRLPIRPDAFFSLEDSLRPAGINRAHFALEADRSTTTQTRFEEKIRAYWNYIEQGLHAKKYGVKGFRILTVTLTDSRARNLCVLAASVVPERARKYFLFAPLKILTSATSGVLFREPTCYSARTATNGEPFPLVPTPNGLQKELGNDLG